MPCESLKNLQIPNTTITVTESINPIKESPGVVVHGVWQSPPSAFGQTTVDVPFCRVVGTVPPGINFEVWLPPADNWNGKFNGVGNGALAGGINYPAMRSPLTTGYATASTNGGHTSPSPVAGDWMMDNPDLWDDFGYRAVHEMTIASKAIVEAFYGKAPDYSYFTGCSGGGQQGLAEVQRYPADYDGVVSGAPANFPTRMWPGETWSSYVTHRTPENLVPPEKLPLISQASVAACDELDGVKDGLIGDPRVCKFDPATLLCKGADAADCLTGAQVDSVKKVYEGLKDPTTGEQFWPGYEPGSEPNWAGHIGEPFIIPQGYFKAMVFNDPNWDWKTFDFTDPEDFAILVDADARYAPILNATDPNLSAFNELGGKLILWHGWADQNIAPRNSINYYNNAVAAVGDEAATQDFLRLFMVPGMGHCSGGTGPNTFNALAALEEWVEKGTAPTQIIASRLKDGQVERTRPLCVYPQVAVYNGSGSSDEAANFTCANPK
jgi:feruloyl esterase